MVGGTDGGIFYGITRPVNLVGGIALGALALVSLIGLAVSGVFAFLLFLMGSGVVIYLILNLLSAKSKVLREKETSFWGGKGKLVAWDPIEGVLFLRNKQINLTDDNPDDGGGIHSIFPILGEEIALRVPLEIQTTIFKDENILTKEYIPIAITGTMYWKISDIKKFYLLISKEIHFTDDQGHHAIDRRSDRPQLESAKEWLRQMAEQQTRALISTVGTGLMISDQISSDLKENGADFASLNVPEASEGYRTVTETLAAQIQHEFQQKVSKYGLAIERVALQDVKLDPEIYKAAVDACKSAYLPLKAKAEAMARKIHLEAEASVIGKDAVALKEIAGNVPALAMQEFLAPIFMKYQNRVLPDPPAQHPSLPSQ